MIRAFKAYFYTIILGAQVIGPDFQPPAAGMPQGQTFFFPNQANPAAPTYQSQPAPRQQTPPLQQSQVGVPTQVIPVAAPFVNPTTYPAFPPSRIYNPQVMCVFLVCNQLMYLIISLR